MENFSIKSHPTMYGKHTHTYPPQPNVIYSRYARLVQYLTTNQGNPSHQRIKKAGKSHDLIN